MRFHVPNNIVDEYFELKKKKLRTRKETKKIAKKMIMMTKSLQPNFLTIKFT